MKKAQIKTKAVTNKKEAFAMQKEQLLNERWYEAYEDEANDFTAFLSSYLGVAGYLDRIGDTPLTAAEVAAGVRKSTAETFGRGLSGLEPPAGLTPMQLAYIIINRHDVALVPPEHMPYPCAPRSCCYIFIYQTDGPDKGTYKTRLEDVILQYEPCCPDHKMAKVASRVHDLAERAQLCASEDLVPVNNGIFNCRTKELMPFSAKHIFIGKSPLDYVPDAVNPVIHNTDDGTDWDAESWLSGLSDDPETMDCLWELLDTALRPNKWFALQNPLYSCIFNLADCNSKSDFATFAQLVTGLSGWTGMGECHANGYLERKDVLEYILWRVLNRDS